MYIESVACLGICMGGGQKSEKLFLFVLLFNISKGGPAQKIADKISD